MSREDAASTEPLTANASVASTAAPVTPEASASTPSGSAPQAGEPAYVSAPRTVRVTQQPDRTVYVDPPSAPAPPESRDLSTAGAWVTVLESLPQSDNSYADAQSRATSLTRASAPEPFVLDSSNTPGLRGGYWAVVVGYYGSESNTRSACPSFGRAQGGTCYPRQLK